MKLNIKSNFAFLLVAFAVVAQTGCKKFVEDEDPSNLTPGSYYTIPEHATAAIASAYSQMRFMNGGAGIFANNFQLLESMSGTAKTETGQNSDLNNIIGMSFNGDNLFVNNWWNGLYNVIAQTNLILDRVPLIPNMDENERKKILGEATFIRAWSYFYLVRLWGDVPLILTPQTLASEDFFPGRTSAEQVYTQILADLTSSEASGLPWIDGTGRASMGAVKSLLSFVHLTMAGFPLNKGVASYTLAAAKAKEVIDNGTFSLFNNYGDLHNVAKENQQELIFQIQYLVGVADNPNQAINIPNFKEISAIGTEVGSCVPTNAFVASYDPGDNRVKDRVGMFFSSYYDGGFGPLKSLGASYSYKNFDSLCHGSFGSPGAGNSSLNITNIRYAEVLLTYAEAQNEIAAAPSVDAIAALQLIRSRAGLVTAGAYTTAAFRNVVLEERWHELCYEGITWFDMVRLRQAYKEATKTFEPFVGHKFADNGATLAEKHLLLPLPTSETRNNINLTPNNPGY